MALKEMLGDEFEENEREQHVALIRVTEQIQIYKEFLRWQSVML